MRAYYYVLFVIVQVMINGLISFGSPYPTFFNQPFPGPDTLLLIAPFWDDVNTNDGGTISYEIHTSGDSLQLVSGYVSSQIGEVYEGYWMMVIFWDQVPPFSFFTAASEVSLTLEFLSRLFQSLCITGEQLSSHTDHGPKPEHLCHLYLRVWAYGMG